MDMLDRLNVAKLEALDHNMLCQIIGGAAVSGTLINAITSGLKLLLELGRSLGTAIKRISNKKTCSV